jgi:hypothetical protein
MDNLLALGRWMVIGGIALAIMGGLVWLFARFSGMSSLPGTLQINIPGGTCIIPVLGSIVLSIVLTLLLNLLIRLFNR